MINIIESVNKSSSSGIEAGKNFAETSIQYAKLKVFYFSALATISLSKLVIIGSFLFIGLLFLSVSGAIAIGNYLNNISVGYLIIAVIYMLIGLLFFIVRKKIEKHILRELSKKVFK